MSTRAGTPGTSLHGATGQDTTTDAMIEVLLPADRSRTTITIAKNPMAAVCDTPMTTMDAETSAHAPAADRRTGK